MLRPRRDQVDAGGFDAGMAQHVGELHHVPARFIKGPGKKVPQVVGEDLPRLYPRFPAEGFHLRPDLFPRKAFAASGGEYLPGGGFLLFGVAQQFAAELSRQEDGAGLALEGDLRFPGPGRLGGDIPHLADPDAGGTDGFQQEGKAFLFEFPGGFQKAEVVGPRQFPPWVAEDLFLDPQEADADVFISMHHNSVDATADANNVTGLEVYYFTDHSEALAADIAASTSASTGRTNRGDFQSYYVVTKMTYCPAVLTEIGYIVNPAEYEDLIQPETIFRTAASFTKSILDVLS